MRNVLYKSTALSAVALAGIACIGLAQSAAAQTTGTCLESYVVVSPPTVWNGSPASWTYTMQVWEDLLGESNNAMMYSTQVSESICKDSNGNFVVTDNGSSPDAQVAQYNDLANQYVTHGVCESAVTYPTSPTLLSQEESNPLASQPCPGSSSSGSSGGGTGLTNGGGGAGAGAGSSGGFDYCFGKPGCR